MDMKNLFPAIVLSLVIHALVAGALIAYLEYAPHPDVLATLDLSSVKLSFSEQVAETQPVAATPEILQQKVRPFVAISTARIGFIRNSHPQSDAQRGFKGFLPLERLE